MRSIVNLTNYQYKKVVIGNITIEQDDEGRYCLNDVHKAGGGAITKSPAQWMRHGAFKELQEEIMLKSTINPVETKPGRTGGTYVVKALVYAYAMWINPGFHLKVIEAYDRIVKDGVAVHESAAQDLLTNPLKYLQPLLAQAQELMEEKTRLEQAAEENVPKVEYYEAVKNAVNCQTMEQVAKNTKLALIDCSSSSARARCYGTPWAIHPTRIKSSPAALRSRERSINTTVKFISTAKHW